MEQEIQLEQALNNIQRLIENIEKVIRGKRAQIQFILTALLAKGHILMEDNPGTGKTVMAKTLAQSISAKEDHHGVNFKRIQFTPDLLPMDLIGSHIFDDVQKEFIFKKGPLFCNVLLADEINRASPKVQSALLECMAENQITMGDITYKLENLFFTIATQNPIEMEGTYPLPAAQLDRFFIKIIFGYVDEATELDIYKDYLGIQNNLDHIEQVLSMDEILFLQKETEKVFMHEEIIAAVRNIVWGTRKHSDITLGASTRSGITFLKCLKAFALVNGRSFVTEDDIKILTHPVLDHRLIYRNKDAKQKALAGILDNELARLSKLNINN
ncbi:MoxR family ATPase [Panacibacter ginsenosidivorans]|uniref:MoxR family ATPase n=1 Tax=Panacibacter ginsenosidivorans TaxID=1813871 RepID=A0A5B8VH41_9BACT|nr:MoxR family ATPase [Panacibacter ginsenosidivorans]QEC69628.1 MoxR family ATPase [Panacibacter ginsenosidivorans]